MKKLINKDLKVGDTIAFLAVNGVRLVRKIVAFEPSAPFDPVVRILGSRWSIPLSHIVEHNKEFCA